MATVMSGGDDWIRLSGQSPQHNASGHVRRLARQLIFYCFQLKRK